MSDPKEQGFQKVLKNALRLFEDAFTLNEDERYASALSLAVLCIEECAKAYHLKQSKQTTRMPHLEKQKLFPQMLKAQLMGLYLLMFSNVIRTGLPAEMEVMLSQLPAIKSEDGCEQLKKVRSKLETPQGRIGALMYVVLKSFEIDGTTALSKLVENSYFDKEKQRGFYADLSSSGEVLSDPDTVTNEEAERMLMWAMTMMVTVPLALRESDYLKELIAGSKTLAPLYNDLPAPAKTSQE